MLRWLAALAHICRFIAGATNNGQSRASVSVDSRSSARPLATLARKSADAGATTMASAPRDRLMWLMPLSASDCHRSVMHRPAGQRLQRQRGDEPARRLRHAHVHGDVRLDEEPRKLRGLVGGDAARQAQNQPRKRLRVHHPRGECTCDGAEFTLPPTHTPYPRRRARQSENGWEADSMRTVVQEVSERPRERLLARGATALSDAELVALLLRTGTGGASALDVARDLIIAFWWRCRLVGGTASGGRSSARCRAREVCRDRGRRRARPAIAVRGRAQRGMLSLRRKPSVTICGCCLRPAPTRYSSACFWTARTVSLPPTSCFEARSRRQSVYPREVVKAALAHNAAAMIFAHNHPSGVAEPSRADELLTQALKQALALVDIRTLDHFVVAGGQADLLRRARAALTRGVGH